MDTLYSGLPLISTHIYLQYFCSSFFAFCIFFLFRVQTCFLHSTEYGYSQFNDHRIHYIYQRLVMLREYAIVNS